MTNAVDIQEYITTLAPETDWWSFDGVLGLGLFGSLVATIGVFHLVGFGIAMYHQKKTHGKFKPVLWVKEIFRGGSIWGMAVLGRPTPRAKAIASDGAYQPIPSSEVLRAVRSAREKMVGLGWTIDAYQFRNLDCEDFGYMFKALVTFELRGSIPKGRGVPIGLIGYTRDSDGVKHVVAFVDTTDRGRLWFEAFPNKKGERPQLTPTELASIDMEIL